MTDYMPLDLTPCCNADLSLLDQVPAGTQRFQGLPFQIGERIIALGENIHQEPVVIPIRSKAYHIVFAQRLLELTAMIGTACAEYVFEFENGGFVVTTLRDRFEIGVIPSTVGRIPLLTYADTKDSLLSRYEGNWDRAGVRACEIGQGRATCFHLWAWQNPYPEQTILSI